MARYMAQFSHKPLAKAPFSIHPVTGLPVMAGDIVLSDDLMARAFGGFSLNSVMGGNLIAVPANDMDADDFGVDMMDEEEYELYAELDQSDYAALDATDNSDDDEDWDDNSPDAVADRLLSVILARKMGRR